MATRSLGAGPSTNCPPRCGYEAFLAQEEEKIILIAVDSKALLIARAFRRLTAAALLGLTLGVGARYTPYDWPPQVTYPAAFAGAMSFWAENRSARGCRQ